MNLQQSLKFFVPSNFNLHRHSIYVAVSSKKKKDVCRMTLQIEIIRGNKKFDDINQSNVNRGYVNRRITVFLFLYCIRLIIRLIIGKT